MELELDHALLEHDLARFHQQARRAYLACAEAVQEELARQQSSPAEDGEATERAMVAEEETATPREEDRRAMLATQTASPRQLSFARQLATQIRGLGIRRLETLVTSRFQVPLVGLSSTQVSELILLLKQLRAGKADLESVLENACCQNG